MAIHIKKAGHDLIRRQPSRYNSISSLVFELTSNGKGISQQERQHYSGQETASGLTSDDNSNKQVDNDNESNISVTFIRPDGSRTSLKASQGKTLYDAVIDNNVDIDGFGACEGTLCCTTCHLIFKQSDYEKIGEPRDEELDMLDLAYGLTDTSRLGCQVVLKKELDPLEVQVPASINDVRTSET